MVSLLALKSEKRQEFYLFFHMKVVYFAVRFATKICTAVLIGCTYFHGMQLKIRCLASKHVTFSREAKILNPFRKSLITIGSHTLCMGELLLVVDNAYIHIGEWTYIGPGAKIWAMKSIFIGNRVFISHGVHIFDNNSHSLSAHERHQRFRELRIHGKHLIGERIKNASVVVEDDVWIGFNAAILKGVTIGKGAVIGACSVVTHDIQPYSIVVGNPARQVGISQK